MTAQILLKKTKRATAAYIQAECERTPNPTNLSDLLDIVLDTQKPISEFEVIDWCQWLTAGGKTPEEFSSIVLRYDNATTCGLVWTANFVAYRCRTCGISPCMSLCAECFQKGNHEGHDFNMFRSQAGGACDCGDSSVMRESGFCYRHGSQAQGSTPPAPPDLLCIAGHIMPRIFLRLLQHLRENSVHEDLDSSLAAVHQADDFLTMIHGFSAMGAAMRGVMTRAITNPQVYNNLCENGNSNEPSYQQYVAAVNSLPSVEAPPEYKNLVGLQEKLVHKTLLEELVFWTVKFEFPQKLVCLLLNMLPDPDYKEAFTQAFVLHYSRISLMLVGSTDSEMISNRVVHVSVQLFSNKNLAYKMTQDLGLLEIMVVSLEFMISKILILCTLTEESSHYVVDCASHVMKDHCYWPLVSDLNNVLSHEPIALRFMQDDSLLEKWFHFLSMFQGMNVNRRELTHHVEFEPNTYYAAFSSELEASASPMWALISHLKDEKTLDYTLKVLRNCENALRNWCKSLKLFALTPNYFDLYQVSFHLPLHRYYSVFMSQAIRKQGATLSQVLPSQELISVMMLHLLRVQVAFYEILCGLWVRNGLQIKGQAMTYIQCHFCNSMVDADIYLLQMCATQIAPNTFLCSILDKFHILESLTFSLSTSQFFLVADEMPMVESCLIFLATLMTVHTNIGLTERELSELEMVTLLCMGDKTHSQLMELMPEKCGTGSQSRDFELVLNQVADYKAPNFEASGNMQQGMYVPKDHTWENLYDPIYVLLRAVQRRDFQTSLDRFSTYARQSGKYKGAAPPWPPFRLPSKVFPSYSDPRKALHCSTFYGLIFTLLYKAVYNSEISEHIMALTIYLLELALLSIPEGSDMDMEVHQNEEPEIKFYVDQAFDEWFKNSNIRVNLRQVVDKVFLEAPQSIHSGGSDGEMEPEFAELDMDISEAHDNLNTPNNVAMGEVCGLLELPSTSQSKELIPAFDKSHKHCDNPEVVVPITPESEENCGAVGGSDAASSHSSGRELVLSSMKKCVDGTDWKKTWNRSESSEEESGGFLKELPSQYRQVWINESIISLLLKLHSKLSNKPDSYVPLIERRKDSVNVNENGNSRIGDGPYFVSKILDLIWTDDMANRDHIVHMRDHIWPKKKEDVKCSSGDREFLDREERRRKARERQQKLMAEFASKQKQFLEQTMESESSEENIPTEDSSGATRSPLADLVNEYDCVICGQSTPSTEDKPIGLVVLIQATSVLGHRYRSTEKLVLPTDADTSLNQESLASYSDKRISEFIQHFDSFYWLMSLNIGWEGGIHVQTCGHHLHLSCHKSYLRSLRSQQRQPPILAVERGEYSCPLCRQLANSALPLSSYLGNTTTGLVKARNSDFQAVASELLELIKEDPPPLPRTSNLTRAMGSVMEDMTSCTYMKFRSFSSPCPQSIFLFVCSIARINLEMEIINRGGSLCKPLPSWQPKRSCIGPLLHVLAMHSKVLDRPDSQLWCHITGQQIDVDSSSVSLYEKGVPILIKDVITLLLQFVFTLPLLIDRAYYTSLVKSLFNVLYFQALTEISCLLTEEQRSYWKSLCEKSANSSSNVMTTLSSVLGHVLGFLEHSHLYFELNVISKDWNNEDIELEIQTYCLQFLRIAALLRQHLYVEELPVIEESSMEFWHLANYLELVNFTSEGAKGLNCACCLNWCSPNPSEIVKNWCTDYSVFVNKSPTAARSLIMQHISWQQPHLLRLPHDYDKIFQYYHKKQCKRCNRVPKEPSVCLLCGTLICLREKCCKIEAVCEAVQHSIDCGAGTAMFLSVNSSCIIVIRGKRACLWGSVFLDSFGEEDRDLKRGKPLYLSKERYQLLEQQWLQHSFDHTNKRWVWHKDNL